MDNSAVTLRHATPEDSVAILNLIRQLGYTLDHTELTERITHLNKHPKAELLITARSSEVIGFVQGYIAETLVSGGYAVISSLVVNEKHRGTGSGRMLINAFGDWAKSNKVVKLRLGSQTFREDSHRFYEHLGFTRTKTQHWFEIKL